MIHYQQLADALAQWRIDRAYGGAASAAAPGPAREPPRYPDEPTPTHEIGLDDIVGSEAADENT